MFSQAEAFSQRDEIKQVLAGFLKQQKTAVWLTQLQQHDIWSMEVLNWRQMKAHEAYKVLQMEQALHVGDKEVITSRCPIRINGERLFSNKKAPRLGEQTEKIKSELVNGTI
jgi:CoA:oxalate CoA-transferase